MEEITYNIKYIKRIIISPISLFTFKYKDYKMILEKHITYKCKLYQKS